MRIYVERENHREGIWMELPVSKEEAEQVRRELEKRHPSIMMPFVAAVESRFPEIERGLIGELVFQSSAPQCLMRCSTRWRCGIRAKTA